MKAPVVRWSLPLWALAAGLAAQEPSNQVPIELPVYTVTDSRELPPPEKWSYGRIDGFEVLSNASEGSTKKLVRDFQKFYQAIGIVWPGVQRPSAVPAMLVICGKGGKFDAFMPDGEQHPDRAMASLSLRDHEQAAIVIDYEAKVINLVTPEGTAAAAAAPTTDADGNPVAGGGDPGFEVDAYKQLYREYIHFLLAGVQPRAPAWLEEGLAQIFMAMEVTDRSITVGQVEDPNTISVAQAAMNDAGTGGTAPQEDRDFNAALANRGLLSMDQLFAVANDSAEARNPLGSTWAKQCYAFVHWGLYGDDGKHQRQFLTFVIRVSKEPLTEALFREIFKQSYKDMGITLRSYIEFTSHKIVGVQAKKGQKLPEPPPFALRDATQSEVGRIKGDTLRLAHHDDAARLAMIAPYVRGERDPQLLAALGLLEHNLKNDAKARTILEAAATAKAVRPRAYLELARLRYADALAKPAAGDRLDVTQTASVLTPLFTARSQPPAMPEVYELIGDAWAHCAITPTAGHLGVLDEGIRVFPRDTGLVYTTAALKVRAGLIREADTLINLGLRVATDADTRAKFEKLRASLPPLPAAAPAITPAAGK